MKKSARGRRTGHAVQADLFTNQRHRLRRSLMLPVPLAEAADAVLLRGERQDRALKVLQHWAKLEREGHLRKKETALDADFLLDVFGQGLGYATATQSPQRYHLVRNFTVPGVGTADGAIGIFVPGSDPTPVAVIELKNAETDLDTDRFNGRTPVQQCWDYLNALPDCPWGIVSNFVSFRLYHRNKTPLAYEEFRLQDLEQPAVFRPFYYLFERDGLLTSVLGQPPRALALLEQSDAQRIEVGDKLYRIYSDHRLRLIRHLRSTRGATREGAIRIAQKLLDRILFIAFCEQRGLLPDKCLEQAYETLPPFSKVTNPRWRNFLDLFHAIDKGHARLDLKTGYNGGLFRHDPEVDDLQLDDNWTDFFHDVTAYDFRDEVNVDVLGHIFERSIGDLERLRSGGLFEDTGADTAAAPAMRKSAERKRSGTYYTPPDFTRFLVRETVSALIAARREAIRAAHGLNPDDLIAPVVSPALGAFWHACWEDLPGTEGLRPGVRQRGILDAGLRCARRRVRPRRRPPPPSGRTDRRGPARNHPRPDPQRQPARRGSLGGGRRDHPACPLDSLGAAGQDAGGSVAQHRLGQQPGRWAGHPPRARLGHQFPGGLRPRRTRLRLRDWQPALGTPEASGTRILRQQRPRDRRRRQRRRAPPADRGAGAGEPGPVRRLPRGQGHCRPHARLRAQSGRYPLTAQGDVNTYMLFAELARALVAPHGRVGLLVPSGIATDHTTKEFFAELMRAESLIGVYDFENRLRIFPDVDGRFKFCALLFGGSATHTGRTDFVFFAHRMSDLQDKRRHITLSARDLALLNPNTRTCPIFRSRRDAELTKAIYRRVPILIDEARQQGGNPWGIKYLTMFHQTNDAELFQSPDGLRALGCRLDGNRWEGAGRTFLPLYEAKMIQAYDHRAASVVIAEANWVRQGQTEATSLVEHQNPEFVVQPRWWVAQEDVARVLGESMQPAYLSYKDVTSPTNERTMIAAFIPRVAVVNSAPLMRTGEGIGPRLLCCLLANLNSVVLDYVARQKVGGVHLNFFIVNQFPILAPDFYAQRCPWDRRQTRERWISERVLKLTCTANDLIPLAQAADFEPVVHKWQPIERAELTAELDAAFFLFYGLSRDEAAYVLSTFRSLQAGPATLLGTAPPAELILAAYDRLAARSTAP